MRLSAVNLLGTYLRARKDEQSATATASLKRAFRLFFDRMLTCMENGFPCEGINPLVGWYALAETLDSFFKGAGKCNFELLMHEHATTNPKTGKAQPDGGVAPTSLCGRFLALLQAIPHIPYQPAQFHLLLAGNRAVRYSKKADRVVYQAMVDAKTVRRPRRPLRSNCRETFRSHLAVSDRISPTPANRTAGTYLCVHWSVARDRLPQLRCNRAAEAAGHAPPHRTSTGERHEGRGQQRQDPAACSHHQVPRCERSSWRSVCIRCSAHAAQHRCS